MSSQAPSDLLRGLPIGSYPFESSEDIRSRCEIKIAELTAEQRERLAWWVAIGRRNPWIQEAVNRPFTVLHSSGLPLAAFRERLAAAGRGGGRPNPLSTRSCWPCRPTT